MREVEQNGGILQASFWAVRREFDGTRVSIVLLILVVNVIRFCGLSAAPPGFHFDEAIVSAEAISIAETGRSSSGERALFVPSGGGGFASPTHIYPKAIWIWIAGKSISSMRAYAGLEALLLLGGVALCAFVFWGGDAALLSLLSATLSPWIFQFSRIANDDPMLSLAGMTWGLYFLSRSERLRDAAWAAFCFSVSAYAYSSARIVFPATVLFYLWVCPRDGRLKVSYLSVLLVVGSICCFPILWGAYSGKLLSRYAAVGIFTSDYAHIVGSWFKVAEIFLTNFADHFSPTYLFISGDANFRHSTQFVGELSWLDDFALAGAGFLLATNKARGKSFHFDRKLALVIFGILIAAVPSAATWEGIPHSIRGSGGWPYFSLLSGYLLFKMSQRIKWLLGAALIVAGCFETSYLYSYFYQYPKLAASSFDPLLVNSAEFGRVSGDWSALQRVSQGYPDTAIRYYLTVYGGLRFAQTARLFSSPGIVDSAKRRRSAEIVIHWSKENPARVKVRESYTIAAEASSPDGLLSNVNVWKDQVPFSFAGGADGASARSGNSTVDDVPGWCHFTAQASDASGRQSDLISCYVEVSAPEITANPENADSGKKPSLL